MKLFKKKDRLLLAGAVVLGGINAALSAFLSILLQKIIDVAVTGDLTGFHRLIPIMLAYLCFLGVLGFLEAYCGKLLLRSVSKHLRSGIFQGVMTLSPSSYFSKNTADYLSALVNDVKLVEENFLTPLLLCSQMAVLFLTTLGILFYFSPLVTLILLFSLILMFLIPALLGKKMQKRQDAYSEQLSVFTTKAKDFLNGYEVIRGYAMLPYIHGKFAQVNEDTARKKFSADSLLAVNESFSDILSSFSVIAIVFVSAYLMLEGQITMGTLLALIQLSSTFITPVVLLMQNIPKVSSMKPVLERLSDLSANSPSSKGGGKMLPGGQTPAFCHSLTCHDVCFGYHEDQPVLCGVCLQLNPGGKYALLGPSGSGKSTLIKLLTGYFSEFQGEICFDGISIRDISLSGLNGLVSVIHQNVFLFDSDIRENICLGEKFPEAELAKALESSGVTRFLPSLEKGLDTLVGENGQNLSGGQKQRIAVARALIRHTPILVIDEGTSAVDQQTACEIEEHLLRQENLTVLTITHHMKDSLVPFYDKIFHLEKGTLA